MDTWLIKVSDLSVREPLLKSMRDKNIGCIFHYVPLHSAEAGLKFGRFHGDDIYTTRESQRIVRLPLYYSMANDDVDRVINTLQKILSA